MAFKKSFDVTEGFLAKDAYIRVQNVNIAHNGQSSATVYIHVNEQSKEPFKVLCYGFQHSHKDGNAVAQAYAHLKTLPEFAGAIDC